MVAVPTAAAIGAVAPSVEYGGWPQAVGLGLISAVAVLFCRWRTVALGLGPLLFLWLGFVLDLPGLSMTQHYVLGVTAWTAAWWLTEPIPIPATSLLPAMLFPLFGVFTATEVSKLYCHHLILLLLGGFFIARGIEVWSLHRRIALTVIRWVGPSPRQLVFGFVLAAGGLSMWISNTATTLMLVPIALSIVRRFENNPETQPIANKLALCLLLGVAYGANVGGVGTLIGTPPNLIFAAQADALGLPIDFRSWLVVGAPVVIIFLPVLAFLLTRVLIPVPGGEKRSTGREIVQAERQALGRITRPERRVLTIFIVTAVLWTTKGGTGVPGWSHLFVSLGWLEEAQLRTHVTDSLVALAMAGLMFILPSGCPENPQRPILEWKDVETVPWGMLFLFGGGFAIAGAFQASGLSDVIGQALSRASHLPQMGLLSIVAIVVTFLTEVTSNTATTNILMPILAAAAVESGLHPYVLMLPAILAVSFAFMMPVATAPNAIVFATGRIPILKMLATGFVLNIVGAVVVVLVVQFWALPYFLRP